MFALIGNLDSMELVVVLIAAILIFGRRLPQVAAQAGAQLGKLRRTLDTAWKDSGADHEVREMQRSIESIRDAVPRDLSAGSVARLAANEFQRRVERNQTTEEGLASAPVAADTSSGGAPAAVRDAGAPREPDATVARGAIDAVHAAPAAVAHAHDAHAAPAAEVPPRDADARAH